MRALQHGVGFAHARGCPPRGSRCWSMAAASNALKLELPGSVSIECRGRRHATVLAMALRGTRNFRTAWRPKCLDPIHFVLAAHASAPNHDRSDRIRSQAAPARKKSGAQVWLLGSCGVQIGRTGSVDLSITAIRQWKLSCLMAVVGARRSFARNQYFATRKEGKLSRPDGTMSYIPLTASVSKLAGAFAIPQADVGASSLGFPCRCEQTRG
jgi:hypothetical protein